MGIALASQKKVDMQQSLEFTEHARILLISMLFILLTARMQISDITGLPLAALGFIGVVILIARPLSVWVSTIRSGLSKQERTFLGAMAPRGVVAAAVSSLFALELVESGHPEASILMPMTFAVIASTVLVSGLSAVPLVRVLGLGQVEPQGVLVLGADRVGRAFAVALARRGIDVLVIDSDGVKVDEARKLSLRAKKGEILSRRVLRDLDLDGIGHFVATTPNDDVNTLAVSHFRRLFGDENVHQVRPSTSLGRPLPEYAGALQAPPIAAGATLDKLDALIKGGGRTVSLELDGTQTVQSVREEFGPDSAPLFAVNEDDRLTLVHADEELPGEGKLVVLAPP
jgi:hypothetical protein